jgi:hypothetical protein
MIYDRWNPTHRITLKSGPAFITYEVMEGDEDLGGATRYYTKAEFLYGMPATFRRRRDGTWLFHTTPIDRVIPVIDRFVVEEIAGR